MVDNVNLYKHIKEGDLELIRSVKTLIKSNFPSDNERGVFFMRSNSLLESLSELKGQLLMIQHKAGHRLKVIEAEEVVSYQHIRSKEDRVSQLLLDCNEYNDLYIYKSELDCLIGYINDLWWSLRGLLSIIGRSVNS